MGYNAQSQRLTYRSSCHASTASTSSNGDNSFALARSIGANDITLGLCEYRNG